MIHKLIIIGSGPAGLTAAIYASRAELEPFLFEGAAPGGPLVTTTDVENYPGFPEGVLGPDLVSKMRKQAEHFGAKIITKNVDKVDFSSKPFKVWADNEEYQAETIIIATGTEPRKLGLESEKKFAAKGISYCATCDGPLFKNKKVAVVGGGDSAMEEATFLAKFASELYILNRTDQFKASKIMLEEAKKNPKIKFMTNVEVKEFLGDNLLNKIKIINNKINEESELDVQGVFVAIGRAPNTGIFEGQLKMEKGYIITQDNNKSVKTDIPGVFCAGDVSDWEYRQAITAAGKGCEAALEAERLIRGGKGKSY